MDNVLAAVKQALRTAKFTQPPTLFPLPTSAPARASLRYADAGGGHSMYRSACEQMERWPEVLGDEYTCGHSRRRNEAVVALLVHLAAPPAPHGPDPGRHSAELHLSGVVLYTPTATHPGRPRHCLSNMAAPREPRLTRSERGWADVWGCAHTLDAGSSARSLQGSSTMVVDLPEGGLPRRMDAAMGVPPCNVRVSDSATAAVGAIILTW